MSNIVFDVEFWEKTRMWKMSRRNFLKKMRFLATTFLRENS